MAHDQQQPAQKVENPRWVIRTRRILTGLFFTFVALVVALIVAVIVITQVWDAESKEGLRKLDAIAQRFEASPSWTETRRQALWENDCGQWTSSSDCNSLVQSWDTGEPYRPDLFAEVTGRFDGRLSPDSAGERWCNEKDAHLPFHYCTAEGVVDGFRVSVSLRSEDESTNVVIHLRVKERGY